MISILLMRQRDHFLYVISNRAKNGYCQLSSHLMSVIGFEYSFENKNESKCWESKREREREKDVPQFNSIIKTPHI